MTWGNRFRLLLGFVVVLAIVAGATLVLNQRQSQVASTTASIQSVSYTVGSDYAGTVVSQAVNQGDRVKKGQPLFTVQSATLLQALTGPSGQKVVPQSTAYTVSSDGMLTLVATEPGIVSTIGARVGSFISAGEGLATIDRSGSLYALAKFRVDSYDFSRIDQGASVELVLPNQQRVPGTVSVIRVQTIQGQADAEVEVKSSGLTYGAYNGLVQPGTPVNAIMHLRDNGPFAGVKVTFSNLLQQIGL
ncbi:MAG: hypothetical protein JWP70_1405 [Leifsonia sp.]|jgi:multidrug resistance efflux pump|nr:hypothetical protein [Leifsonia sp.]MDQ1589125.1 hypothetical protein [Microbacteriaceae bacterium]